MTTVAQRALILGWWTCRSLYSMLRGRVMPSAGERVVERSVDVEIEDVPNSYGFDARSLDAGCPVARVVAAIAGFAE